MSYNQDQALQPTLRTIPHVCRTSCAWIEYGKRKKALASHIPKDFDELPGAMSTDQISRTATSPFLAPIPTLPPSLFGAFPFRHTR